MRKATLAFVKGDGTKHTVWITPEGADAYSIVLNVAHDLPHLAVESLLDIDDGLWGALVDQRAYPGLTDAHLVAKALTNSIVNGFGDGPNTVEGVHNRLATYRSRNDNQSTKVLAHLPKIDAELIEAVHATHTRLWSEWMATPVGETWRLDWPLP